MRILEIGCFALILAAVGCTKDDGGPGTGEGQSPETRGVCGGFGGDTCPDGLVCADDASDDCDPARGGADCPGLCVTPPDEDPATCGGFAGDACSEGSVCIDEPGDDCDPSLGGADCPGRCVELSDSTTTCGGFGNFACPEDLVCVDDPRDDCSPPEGADCGGICVRP